MSCLKPGVYRHFKGNLYELLYTATHSETLEKMEKNPQQAEISRTLGAEDVYERLSQLKSAKEMLDALNEMDLDPEREPYLTISKTLHSRWNIERVYGGDIQGTLKILRRNIDEII